MRRATKSISGPCQGGIGAVDLAAGLAVGPVAAQGPLIKPPLESYLALPFKPGGETREGLDCRGLALLWLREQRGFDAPTPASHAPQDEVAEDILTASLATHRGQPDREGDVVFFRHRGTGKVRHVAVCLGRAGYLHQLGHHGPRVDRSLELLRRVGFDACGSLGLSDASALAVALSDRKLGDPFTVFLFVVSIALSAASAFLMPKPKLGQFRPESGRYGFDNLATATNPQLPLPDILGAVTVSGNSPYQSLIDKSQPATDPTQQKVNKIVILGAGPFTAFEHESAVVKLNGRDYRDTFFHPSGIALAPAQTKAEAVDGIISSENSRPSVTNYLGTYGIAVPVDVRAQYDRNFPIYGFNGCAYQVFRLIDSAKFSSFNETCTPRGRALRTFNSSGFITATSTTEAVGTGDGSTVRFKLDFDDVASVASVTVGGVSYAAASADQPDGLVYALNATRGFIEFPTAPAAASAIVATYTYYVRAWTQNPAAQAVALLTESGRGKGFAEAKIDWTAAAAAQDYNDVSLLWQGAGTQAVEVRHASDYALDYRKPVQDHLRAVLDAGYAYFFLSNGKFVIKPRGAGSSVFSFTSANILRDSFSAEQLDRSALANRVKVNFRPLETYNAETAVARDDEDDQRLRAGYGNTDGVVEETLQMLAVARETHAERLAETVLRENVRTSWVVEFKTTVKGLALEPGDLIDLTHPAKPNWAAKLFRIEDLEIDEQDRLKLKCSEYLASCYT